MLPIIGTAALRSPGCCEGNTAVDTGGEPRHGRTGRRRLFRTSSRCVRAHTGMPCAGASPGSRRAPKTALFHARLPPSRYGSGGAARFATLDRHVAFLAIRYWPFWAPWQRNSVPIPPSAGHSPAGWTSLLPVVSPPCASHARGTFARVVVHHTRQSRNGCKPHLPVNRGNTGCGSSEGAYRNSFIARQFSTPLLQAPILGCCFSLQLSTNLVGWLLRTNGGP